MANFRSNAKLLLSGEYLVLCGAYALALPLKLGQSMNVVSSDNNTDTLVWNSIKPDGHWFSAVFGRKNLDLKTTDDVDKAEYLQRILNAVRDLNPSLFSGNDLMFNTELDFDPEWGLGSSSTLISNLARWAGIDPYELLKRTFGGSGYDIACATATSPLFYHLENGHPVMEPVPFDPPFSDNLYFVYQGRKQQSSGEVKSFLELLRQQNFQYEIDTVSDITRTLVDCPSLALFCYYIRIHEDIVASCIGRESILKRFPKFDGGMKSLGAWGGDFFLAATEWPENRVRTYFQSLGLHVVVPYREWVL